MSGAIPPLPQYAFMACSVKAQGQLYLLPLPLFELQKLAIKYDMKISTKNTSVLAFQGKSPVRSKTVLSDK